MRSYGPVEEPLFFAVRVERQPESDSPRESLTSCRAVPGRNTKKPSSALLDGLSGERVGKLFESHGAMIMKMRSLDINW